MKTTIAVAGTLAGAGLAVVIGATTVIAVADADHLVEGDGYSYTLPAGWEQSLSFNPADNDSAPDTVVSRDDSFDAAASVETSDLPGDILTEANVASALRDELAGSGMDPSSSDVRASETTLDGEPAVRGEIIGTMPDQTDAAYVGYLVEHGATTYVITFWAEGEDADDATREFERLMDSWTWDASGPTQLV